jgi:hypothetical protein
VLDALVGVGVLIEEEQGQGGTISGKAVICAALMGSPSRPTASATPKEGEVAKLIWERVAPGIGAAEM